MTSFECSEIERYMVLDQMHQQMRHSLFGIYTTHVGDPLMQTKMGTQYIPLRSLRSVNWGN